MRRLLLAGLAFAAVVAAVVWVLGDRRPEPPPPADGSLPPGAVARIGGWEFTPITTNSGLVADGTQVIGGSSDGWVRVFDLATGREVRRFPAHTDVTENPNARGFLGRLVNGRWKDDETRMPCDGVRRIAVSADGTRVATAGEHVVRVFRVADGARLADWPHVGPHGLSWLPDGRHVVVTFGVQVDRYDADAPDAPPVRIGSLTSGGGPAVGHVSRFLAFQPNTAQPPVLVAVEEGAVAPKLDAAVGGPVAVRLDGRRTAALDPERKDLVLRDAEGREVGRVAGSPGLVWVLQWTPDGRRLLAGTAGEVRVLDEDGRLERSLDVAAAWSAAFSPDGRRVLFDTYHGIRVVDLETGTLAGAPSRITRWSLPTFADGETLVTIPGLSRLDLFEARTGKLVRTVTFPSDGPWRPFVLHPHGLVGVRDAKGTFRVSDFEGRDVEIPPLQSYRGSVARRADGTWVVYRPEENTLHTYPGDARVSVTTKPTEESGTLSWDARRLFVQVKGGVAVVDTADGVTLAHLPCGEAEVGSIAPTADGSVFLATIGNRIRVLRSDDGAVLWDSGKFSDPGPVVALSPDGARVARTNDAYDRVDVIDVATGDTVASFTGALTPFTWITWSPDAALIATSSLDGTVLVWDVAAAARR